VSLVKYSKTVAKLHMLLVEPAARGLGSGKRLVEECIRFVRQAGYKKLHCGRRVRYAVRAVFTRKLDFQLVEHHRHHSRGHDLVAETWDLVL